MESEAATRRKPIAASSHGTTADGTRRRSIRSKRIIGLAVSGRSQAYRLEPSVSASANPVVRTTDKTSMWTIANQRSALSPRAERWAAGVGELLRIRHLVVSLAWRDVRVRYAQSFLGLGWSLALPIVSMLVFVFVFGRAFGESVTVGLGMPYALYVYSGIVPWTFFSAGLVSSLNSLVANRNLVTKVYFPREVFPLSCVLASFADFIAGLAVLVILGVYLGARGTWAFNIGWTWMFLPILVLIQAALTTGLGMILALANLLYRDVRQVIGVLLQLVMFVSAVVVPIPQDGSRLAWILSLNPMVGLFDGYRECLILARPPNASSLLYAAAVSTVVLVIGWGSFRKMSPRFAECV